MQILIIKLRFVDQAKNCLIIALKQNHNLGVATSNHPVSYTKADKLCLYSIEHYDRPVTSRLHFLTLNQGPGKGRGRAGEGPGKGRGRAGEGPGKGRGRAGEGPGKGRGRAGEGPGKGRGRALTSPKKLN